MTTSSRDASPGTAEHQPDELDRAITARLLFFYVLGDVLGSGIYALVGVMAGQVGGAVDLRSDPAMAMSASYVETA